MKQENPYIARAKDKWEELQTHKGVPVSYDKYPGLRYNKGKPKLSLVLEATKAMAGCANVLEKGCEKYARNNWKQGLAISGVIDSMQRHVASYLEGEDNDQETGLPHVDHILCNALFISELYHTKKELCDDRTVEVS